MSKRVDQTRCAGCTKPVKQDDVWWVRHPKGGKVVACPDCYCAAQAGGLSYTAWQKRQRSFNGGPTHG